MKRSEQKARTKYNIRQAFIDLLQRKEMDNITITELAKSANIDRKTFYLHYDTTFDVYHDIIDDVSNQLDNILKQQNDFDFFIFFNELNQVMQANFKFYQTIAKQKSYGRELAKLLNITPGAVSQHLSILMSTGLIESNNIGNRVYYSLNNKKMQHFIHLLQCTFPLAEEE